MQFEECILKNGGKITAAMPRAYLNALITYGMLFLHQEVLLQNTHCKKRTIRSKQK